MMPLNHILMKCTAGYKCRKKSTTWCTWTTSNFLLKNEKELENLMQTVRIYSQDIGMEFGMRYASYEK